MLRRHLCIGRTVHEQHRHVQPCQHLGRIVFAGVEDPEVAKHLGFESFARVEDAIASVEADLGAGCSIFRPTLPPVTIYRTAS